VAGFIPFEQMPRAYNRLPESSSPPTRTRSRRVTPTASAAISPRLPVSADPSTVVQAPGLAGGTDGHGAAGRVLRVLRNVGRQIVAAYDRRGVASPGLADAVKILRNWNGQMDGGRRPDRHARLSAVAEGGGDRASPGKGAEYDVPCRPGDSVQLAPVAIEKLLRERPRLVLRLRPTAAARLPGRHGRGAAFRRQCSKWDYGTYNQLVIAHLC